MDKITKYAFDYFITPARTQGDYVVGIRAGDIAKALSLQDRLPMICSKLGSNKFETETHVRRVALEGPINGSNALFVYRVK